MSNVNIMRNNLRSLYGPEWAKKVDKMSDKQIVAIHIRFQKKGIIK